MTKLTDRLQHELDVEKASLAENLGELEIKARQLADWRRQVKRHPLAAVGVALAGGVALAMFAGPRKHRDGDASRDGNGNGDGESRHESILSHPLVEQFVVTLATVAAGRAVDLFEERASRATPPSRTDAPPEL